MTNLLATAFVFCIVIYFQGWQVDLPLQSVRQRGLKTSYPIRLFYTSNMPVILHSALVGNVHLISQILFARFPTSRLVRLVGVWKSAGGGRGGGQQVPVAGIVYYLSPPLNGAGILRDPVHLVIYAAFVLASCALLSSMWIEVSGSSTRDVAKSFRDQGLVVAGHRDKAIVHVLQRYIPVAASFGGMCVGLLTILADLLGAIGSGTGMLMAVGTIYGYWEMLKRHVDLEAPAPSRSGDHHPGSGSGLGLGSGSGSGSGSGLGLGSVQASVQPWLGSGSAQGGMMSSLPPFFSGTD
eukprot:CAMPEP_0118866038 /NCGR_PEP_ID=MMETSP1163-20130328/10096_1 /TAXON_ID=124430 /ORGANISM="Phaeomonas parva, Strain CCMP2877" /LENGTH=294 /DNA_ID=CAMNT_0006800321 /DNA_START=17 /DNA_END=902 /DNA_ORIENTATION=+